VIARYVGGNPNGSMRDIAAIRNEQGNVVGIMPHPEHAVDPLTGPSLDGVGFFTSVLKHVAGAPMASQGAGS
jgi:phosphoribosylformylglycinamidine synthase